MNRVEKVFFRKCIGLDGIGEVGDRASEGQGGGMYGAGSARG